MDEPKKAKCPLCNDTGKVFPGTDLPGPRPTDVLVDCPRGCPVPAKAMKGQLTVDRLQRSIISKHAIIVGKAFDDAARFDNVMSHRTASPSAAAVVNVLAR
jgi:hypothetical protein